MELLAMVHQHLQHHIFRHSAGQIGDLTRWQDSQGTTLAVIDRSGKGTFSGLNGGFDGMSRTTDADGKATFEFARAPVGEASLGTFSATYHSASRRLASRSTRSSSS